MADNRANLQGVIDGIMAGKILEGFDRYYHDDVVMSENGEQDPGRVGKAKNRAYEEYFAANAKFHGARVDRVIVDGDHSAYEMWMDFEMGGARMQRTQMAVQTWKNGQIIQETFFYKG